MRTSSGLRFVFFALAAAEAFAGGSPAPAPGYALPGATRTFAITYTAAVTAVPVDARRLRIWLPVPQDSDAQTIRDLKFSRPARLTRGRKYGNAFAYWEIAPASARERITMTFVCTRREVRTDLARLAREGEAEETEPKATLAVFKQPDQRVVVNDSIRALAAEVTTGKSTTLARAQAIYDYVLAHMRYDKSGTGWGTGSTAFACETGRGNCTDFHSLFNSLCRAEGIASEFEIGLYLPYQRHADEPVGGYHCWAAFRVPGRTWVPVDCSEAWREPDRREFFFGALTNNRVTLSVGRDLTLEPAQAGPPLNYFLEPYAEADGQPVAAKKTWSFTDLD